MDKKLPVDNGFFKKFCDKIRQKLTTNEYDRFSNLPTDEARFDFINNLIFIRDVLDGEIGDLTQNAVYQKNLIKSNEFKCLGNKEFQLENWPKALEYYNKSYLYIPSDNHKEIAIIFANRSAALYHMEKYDLALKDIERSMGSGYPKNLMYKVKERKARCLLAKKLHNDALLAFKDALHAIDESQLPQEKRAKLERDVQVMIKLLHRNSEHEKENSKKFKNQTNNKIKETTTGDHKSLDEKDVLSNSVTIDFSEVEGRFARARENIKVGEIIVSERPHVSVLLESYSQSHCAHCFKRSLAPLACPKSVNFVYCSESCQTLSTASQYEAGILPILWQSGASITCHLALRMISQKNEKYFADIQHELNSLTSEVTDKLQNDDYRKIYNLVRHEDQRSAEDYFQRTVMAYFLAECLNEQKYFLNNKTTTFIGGLILRNLQIVQFNAHEISELQQNGIKDPGNSTFIGAALYPTLSLFNHSCDPGIVRYHSGNNVMARAVKNIKAGEVVAENYGPIFTQVAKDERKITLKTQYWFDCECAACQENWPLFKNMDETAMRFKCENKSCKNIIVVPVETNEFMFKCTECGAHTNIFKGLKAVQDTDLMFRTANRLLDAGDNGKALFKYIEMLNILDENLAPPFKDFHLCQQGIRRCMLEFGNRIIFQ